MIRGMRKRGKKEWSVYILRCGDGTLYTGIAKNVALRLKMHNAGKGAAYTRTHLPVTLLYQQNGFTRSKALVREAEIKRFPRPKKEKFILVEMSPKSTTPAKVLSLIPSPLGGEG